MKKTLHDSPPFQNYSQHFLNLKFKFTLMTHAFFSAFVVKKLRPKVINNQYCYVIPYKNTKMSKSSQIKINYVLCYIGFSI